MKILLVLPSADHLRVNQENKSVPKRNMLRFSILPLTTVAALTPAEFDVEICDENVEPLDFETDADIIGISFMTALAPRAYEISCEFRKRGKITVAGGYHATLVPDETSKYFNAVVIGDAEELWPQLLQDIKEDKLRKIYRHEKLPDLAGAPVPRRDLLKTTANHYVTINAVQAGRGCSHGCRYCSISAFHQKTYRVRPVREVIDDLQRIGRDFIFVDDNIIADRNYARQLFKLMVSLKKRWVAQSSLEIADDPKLLDLACEAGCKGLFIGIETTNNKNLDNVGKGFNDSNNYLTKIKTIRRKGIGIIAGIIVGMDNDDVTVFENTYRFLQKCGIDAIQVNILTPLPGTPLFQEYNLKGRITSRNWSNYDFRHVVIKPARMSAAELQGGADWLYHNFYRLDQIILRSIRTLIEVGAVPAYLSFKLNMTYRYDNIRENIIGFNPALRRKKTITSWLRKPLLPLWRSYHLALSKLSR